jgi:hypothetical protein
MAAVSEKQVAGAVSTPTNIRRSEAGMRARPLSPELNDSEDSNRLRHSTS